MLGEALVPSNKQTKVFFRSTKSPAELRQLLLQPKDISICIALQPTPIVDSKSAKQQLKILIEEAEWAQGLKTWWSAACEADLDCRHPKSFSLYCKRSGDVVPSDTPVGLNQALESKQIASLCGASLGKKFNWKSAGSSGDITLTIDLDNSAVCITLEPARAPPKELAGRLIDKQCSLSDIVVVGNLRQDEMPALGLVLHNVAVEGPLVPQRDGVGFELAALPFRARGVDKICCRLPTATSLAVVFAEFDRVLTNTGKVFLITSQLSLLEEFCKSPAVMLGKMEEGRYVPATNDNDDNDNDNDDNDSDNDDDNENDDTESTKDDAEPWSSPGTDAPSFTAGFNAAGGWEVAEASSDSAWVGTVSVGDSDGDNSDTSSVPVGSIGKVKLKYNCPGCPYSTTWAKILKHIEQEQALQREGQRSSFVSQPGGERSFHQWLDGPSRQWLHKTVWQQKELRGRFVKLPFASWNYKPLHGWMLKDKTLVEDGTLCCIIRRH